MEKEIWVDVFGFEKCYQVSNTGKIRSKTRSHKTRNKWGGICKNYTRKRIKFK